MKIANRIKQPQTRPFAEATPNTQQHHHNTPSSISTLNEQDLKALVQQLHNQIIDSIDFTKMTGLTQEQTKKKLEDALIQVAQDTDVALSPSEQDRIVEDLLNDIIGYGPLEKIFADDSITDVLVNGYSKIYIERHGKLELTNVYFRDNTHLLHTIQRITAQIGRRIDESSPMVDARLNDGSRVNAIIPPLALDGPSLSIRRFSKKRFTGPSLIERNVLSKEILQYMVAAVRAHASILVAGGTGSGKTTMLNVLSSYIADDERIVTIEDAAELSLSQPHTVRLESRPPNIEQKGEISIRDLVKNSLRMRPDRIIIGEVRGAEVLDMLQAMNTGHDGSLATIHANTAKDVTGRLMTMIGMTGTPLTETTMAEMIASAIHVIIHVSRYQDGSRRVSEIAEVTGVNGATIEIQPIFAFDIDHVDKKGNISGRHVLKSKTTLSERFSNAGLLSG